jgi:hypothetical protein
MIPKIGRGALAVVAAMVAMSAGASERRFTYTYDSSVLNPGDRELEPWTTIRFGQADYYARFDERVEFEMGVAERLQTAWYLNFRGRARGSGAQFSESFDFQGVSWEWKYKVMDPVADALGLALYGEIGLAPSELELEAKLIFDKRFGPFLAAVNLVGEQEWGYDGTSVEGELKLELDGGFAWLTDFGVALGLELRSTNVMVGGALAHAGVFLGPTVSYSARSWWAALTLQPQLFAPAGATVGGLDLAEFERVNLRILFGWHL